MPDENDPLNPHKAKQNFKEEAYKTAEEKEEEAARLIEENNAANRLANEPEKAVEKPKEERESKPSFVPVALRRKKQKQKPSQPTQTSQPSEHVVQKPVEEVPRVELNISPAPNPSSLLPPSMRPPVPSAMSKPKVVESTNTGTPIQSNVHHETAPKEIHPPKAKVAASDSDSDDEGKNNEDALNSLLGMYD